MVAAAAPLSAPMTYREAAKLHHQRLLAVARMAEYHMREKPRVKTSEQILRALKVTDVKPMSLGIILSRRQVLGVVDGPFNKNRKWYHPDWYAHIARAREMGERLN